MNGVRDERGTGFLPQLDGLRAVAISFVFLCHAEYFGLIQLGGWGKRGWVGVDLFFVLSGFLITRILLAQRGEPHALRNFYLRRALRIWPVYFATVAFVFLVWRGVVGDAVFGSSRPNWVPFVFMIQNLRVPFVSVVPLEVTWSLALEEQFYLVWPLIVRRLSVRALAAVATTMLVFSPSMRQVFVEMGATPGQVYRHTLCHSDGLAAGALLALWWCHVPDGARLLRRVSYVLVALALPLALWLPPQDVWGARSPVQQLLCLAIGFAGVLGLALTARPGGIAYRVLCWRPLQALGRISYGFYLLHMLAIQAVMLPSARALFARLPEPAQRPVVFAACLALSLALSALSWRFLEEPVLRLKRRFASAPSRELAPAAEPGI